MGYAPGGLSTGRSPEGDWTCSARLGRGAAVGGLVRLGSGWEGDRSAALERMRSGRE